MEKIIELQQKRAALVKQARDIQDRCDAEKREKTAEERQQFDKIWEDVNKLANEIRDLEKLHAAEEEIRSTEQHPFKPQPGVGGTSENRRATDEYNKEFRNFLATGQIEGRAIQADVDASGGYLFASEQFVARLIKSLDDNVFMRGLATTMQVTSSDNLGFPTLVTDLNDSDWTTEIQAVTDDAALALGKRNMTPHYLTKLVKISQKLLRVSAIPADTLVADRLAYKFAITQEKAFLTGDGNGKPLGVFTASANGIPTSRDISTGNTPTAITADGLLEAKYNLKAQYRRNAQWLFHRDAVKQIAKLKDSDGQYLWKASVAVGEPDTLLGYAVNESEYVPNTFTTGQYVGMLGDFKQYWIVDNLQFQVQRLVELYAATNQIGFIGRLETDGAPVDPMAFSRIKLA